MANARIKFTYNIFLYKMRAYLCIALMFLKFKSVEVGLPNPKFKSFNLHGTRYLVML